MKINIIKIAPQRIILGNHTIISGEIYIPCL